MSFDSHNIGIACASGEITWPSTIIGQPTDSVSANPNIVPLWSLTPSDIFTPSAALNTVPLVWPEFTTSSFTMTPFTASMAVADPWVERDLLKAQLADMTESFENFRDELSRIQANVSKVIESFSNSELADLQQEISKVVSATQILKDWPITVPLHQRVRECVDIAMDKQAEVEVLTARNELLTARIDELNDGLQSVDADYSALEEVNLSLREEVAYQARNVDDTHEHVTEFIEQIYALCGKEAPTSATTLDAVSMLEAELQERQNKMNTLKLAITKSHEHLWEAGMEMEQLDERVRKIVSEHTDMLDVLSQIDGAIAPVVGGQVTLPDDVFTLVSMYQREKNNIDTFTRGCDAYHADEQDAHRILDRVDFLGGTVPERVNRVVSSLHDICEKWSEELVAAQKQLSDVAAVLPGDSDDLSLRAIMMAQELTIAKNTAAAAESSLKMMHSAYATATSALVASQESSQSVALHNNALCEEIADLEEDRAVLTLKLERDQRAIEALVQQRDMLEQQLQSAITNLYSVDDLKHRNDELERTVSETADMLAFVDVEAGREVIGHTAAETAKNRAEVLIKRSKIQEEMLHVLTQTIDRAYDALGGDNEGDLCDQIECMKADFEVTEQLMREDKLEYEYKLEQLKHALEVAQNAASESSDDSDYTECTECADLSKRVHDLEVWNEIKSSTIRDMTTAAEDADRKIKKLEQMVAVGVKQIAELKAEQLDASNIAAGSLTEERAGTQLVITPGKSAISIGDEITNNQLFSGCVTATSGLYKPLEPMDAAHPRIHYIEQKHADEIAAARARADAFERFVVKNRPAVPHYTISRNRHEMELALAAVVGDCASTGVFAALSEDELYELIIDNYGKYITFE